MTTKALRDLTKALKREGIDVDEVIQHTRRHPRLIVRRGKKTATLLASNTPSDHRYIKNKISEAKRRLT
jgi:hypothetical protein